MKSLILNSGIGKRMGNLTKKHPKCMTVLSTGQTILSRQIAQLEREGIDEIIITTGPFTAILEQHALSMAKTATLYFINNPDYESTNYIYSIFLAKELLRDDIILLHGDLVFSDDVLHDILRQKKSAMTVSSTLPLPKKDFKAVINDGRIVSVGVEFFDSALTAQPLYKLNKTDWLIWLFEIEDYIDKGVKTCYAENALNKVSGQCFVYPFDVQNRLCAEIDAPEDLNYINQYLNK